MGIPPKIVKIIGCYYLAINDGKNGRRLAAAHGNLTPAHADGCAAQCFEGVQRGSIIIPNSESWPPCCHARLQTGLIARLSSFIWMGLGAPSVGSSGSERYPFAYAAQRAFSRCIYQAVYQPGKALIHEIGAFPRRCTEMPPQKCGKGQTHS